MNTRVPNHIHLPMLLIVLIKHHMPNISFVNKANYVYLFLVYIFYEYIFVYYKYKDSILSMKNDVRSNF